MVKAVASSASCRSPIGSRCLRQDLQPASDAHFPGNTLLLGKKLDTNWTQADYATNGFSREKKFNAPVADDVEQRGSASLGNKLWEVKIHN
jgi:hypothetical protein